MPRKSPSDPGKDVKRSIEIMEDLVGALTKFSTIPLKRGLKSNGALEDSAHKKITDVLKRASELRVEVEDLLDMTKDVRPKTGDDPRFQSKMANRVLQRFIASQVEYLS